MPRIPTNNLNANTAVQAFINDLTSNKWGLNEAWLAVSKQLMTCEIWDELRKTWAQYYNQPVLRERNDYKLLANGSPNKALQESTLVGDYIARKLKIPRHDLCSYLGKFLKTLSIQPQNPRGHAFRSIVAETLARYGDPQITVEEEVNPYILFPGNQFNLRSKNPRIDIVAYRDGLPVALCSTRWTYRHDRVDILEEARAYMPVAKQIYPNIHYFGITAEMNPARLKKVVDQTKPVSPSADVDCLVHLHKPLATTVVNHNGDLAHLVDLVDWVHSSPNW
ncbi:hypothetical protein [Synechococcus sp. C9]|jgi:hypothetical protein|uniref:hypothetical protein n=1 Tax=Synechococcus sp. C9 TaxID=102119 RepID=UPI001FF54DAB|nr:hypothetical protein [Synechococcus sp. C9]